MQQRSDLPIPTILMIQGKLVSQMISFIWRYSDTSEQNEKEKKECAFILKACFERTIKDIPNYINFTLTENTEKDTDERCDSYALERLLTFDVRQYLSDNSNTTPTSEDGYTAELLKIVFGETRILTLTNYLSPIFLPKEVDMSEKDKSNYPVYKFFIDQNSFVGTLKDPDLEYRLGFRYMLAYPPRPILSDATLTKTALDAWIENKNEDVYRPSNPFIPVTTS